MIESLARRQALRLSEPVQYLGENLSFGEFPFVPSACCNAVAKGLSRVNRYADPNQRELRKALARYCRVRPQNVVATNGGNEAIELVARAFINPGDKVVVVEPCYPVYESSSSFLGAKVVRVSLREDFSLDEKALLRKARGAKIVWIASPNNPTGNELLSPQFVKQFVAFFKGILVIDECYFEYCGKTFAKLACTRERVIVLRSLSKIGLAGAYLGYLIAEPATARLLDKVRMACLDTSVNIFAQSCAIALLADRKAFSRMLSKFSKLKKQFCSRLSVLGFEVLPSKTSFVLLRCENPEVLFARLQRQGFRVKKSARGLVSLRVPGRKEWTAVLRAFRNARTARTARTAMGVV